MKLLIALFATLMLTSACSMQQNPLEGVSDQVNNGGLPNTNKPVPPTPLDKHNLQIDAPAKVDAAVGTEVRFKIEGRVLIEGINHVLHIDNLESFEGATFNAATGEFAWTPPKSVMGSSYMVRMNLGVTIESLPTDGYVAQSERIDIPFSIVTTFEKPTIMTLQGDDNVIGGRNYSFPFTLVNKDALNKDDISIIPRACSGYNKSSLSSFITLDRYSLKDEGNGTYSGLISMNLYGAENLVAGNYCFGIAAVTRQGLVSDMKQKDMYYEPRLRDSVITQNTSIEVFAGDMQKVSFAIFDPSGFGVLKVGKIEPIGSASFPGLNISCRVDSVNSGVANCTAAIDARNQTAGIYRTGIFIETSNRRGTQANTTKHVVSVNVKAANP